MVDHIPRNSQERNRGNGGRWRNEDERNFSMVRGALFCNSLKVRNSRTV